MNDLELAEMVLSKEITLEDALEMCDDANELLSALKIRKTMRYALKAMAVGRKMEKAAKSREEAAAARQFFQAKVADYHAEMLELDVMFRSQSARLKDLRKQSQDAGVFGERQLMGHKGGNPRIRMISEDFKDLVWEHRYGGPAALAPIREAAKEANRLELKIAELDEQITKLERTRCNYATTAIAQSFAEIFDYLAEELGK